MGKEDKLTVVNRETSWLHFNGRVLQEAADERNPLIERLKFLGIFSNNRDEFFRVRVATLTRMLKVDSIHRSLNLNPRKLLTEINDIVVSQEKDFIRIYQEILDELQKQNIFIINESVERWLSLNQWWGRPICKAQRRGQSLRQLAGRMPAPLKSDFINGL